MNLNPLKSIFSFNKEVGRLKAGYSDERECAYPIGEALEGFYPGYLNDLGGLLDSTTANTPKQISRDIIRILTEEENQCEISDVDRLNKHIGIIVFSLGSLYKLGLTPQQVMKALDIVAQANLQKLHAGQDAEGKQQKPSGFIGPEAQLQKVLDER